MTVDEKALSIIEKWESGTYYGGAVQKKAALQSAIVQALKEQDRDTRHKCAEAVNALPWESVSSGLFAYEAVVSRDDAHAACINVKAV